MNLLLLAASPSGTRKTRTKFAFTLSGRSADNLEPNGTARTFPDAHQSTSHPTTSQSIARQSTDHQPAASR